MTRCKTEPTERVDRSQTDPLRFSKKLENDASTVALSFMYYNFAACIRRRVTPAMEVGIADHVWSVEEIVGLLGSR